MKITVKEIEEKLNDYLNDDSARNHKKNALDEYKKIRAFFEEDDVSNILSIIEEYPDYDHLLFKITNGRSSFIKIGFSKDMLKSLDKKGIHRLAKGLRSSFKNCRWANER